MHCGHVYKVSSLWCTLKNFISLSQSPGFACTLQINNVAVRKQRESFVILRNSKAIQAFEVILSDPMTGLFVVGCESIIRNVPITTSAKSGIVTNACKHSDI